MSGGASPTSNHFQAGTISTRTPPRSTLALWCQCMMVPVFLKRDAGNGAFAQASGFQTRWKPWSRKSAVLTVANSVTPW